MNIRVSGIKKTSEETESVEEKKMKKQNKALYIIHTFKI